MDHKQIIRRYGVKICLLAASMAFSLLLCELILRVIGFENPRFYELNAILGSRLHPGAEGWYRREGGSYVKINSDGLRDREHSKIKPANTIRIAVLGDSYAEAFQVPMEESFWWVMQDRLNGCKAFGDRKVEVLNFGVSGYGTADELLMLENYVWDYSPDVVLLAFFEGNDFRNNSKVLEPEKLRPFFLLRNGRLELDTTFVHAPEWNAWRHKVFGSLREHWLSYHSRIHQLLALLKEVMNQREVSSAANRIKGDEIGVGHMFFIEPKTDDWKDAWLITEALIRRMRDEVEARGARFLLVSLSMGIQVHPDPAVRRDYEKWLGVKDLFYPERRLQSLGEREKIDVLCLSPILLEYAEKNNEFLHGFFQDGKHSDGHYNRIGHRVAGETIAEYLRRRNAAHWHVNGTAADKQQKVP